MDGITTAKVKISVDTKVDVSFISEIYDIVAFGIRTTRQTGGSDCRVEQLTACKICFP